MSGSLESSSLSSDLSVKEAKHFTDWSTPVALGAPINTPFLDGCISISKDGLSLFFSSNRQTNSAASLDRDLYVAHRSSVESPWETPQRIDLLSEVGVWDSCPTLSLDEHRLYFVSTRAGGCGAEDIWVSRRHDRRDDLGWDPPVHLACEADGGVNTSGREMTPALFEGEAGSIHMYFTRNTAWNGSSFLASGWDIYQSEMRADGTFGPAEPVAELNSTYLDMSPVVRRDGLEVLFLSRRPGASAGATAATTNDFWVATRTSTAEPWSSPHFVEKLGSPAMAEGRLALSFDGTELYFSSSRAGGLGDRDIWVARRAKIGRSE
jgi:hypothetical protein